MLLELAVLGAGALVADAISQRRPARTRVVHETAPALPKPAPQRVVAPRSEPVEFAAECSCSEPDHVLLVWRARGGFCAKHSSGYVRRVERENGSQHG